MSTIILIIIVNITIVISIDNIIAIIVEMALNTFTIITIIITKVTVIIASGLIMRARAA